MDPEQLRTVIHAAVNNALAGQAAQSLQKEQKLRQRIEELDGQMAAVNVTSVPAQAPQIKTYVAIEIRDDTPCNEPLDAVKHKSRMCLGDKRL